MYDAIVVGARAAGSPTAMLLARKGYKVLVVDRATFPSDTISTHMLQPAGAAKLKQWGLLERLQAAGTPALSSVVHDFGPFELTGSPLPVDGISETYAPRRTHLDKILLDAARAAGAEVREDFVFEGLLRESDGRVSGIRGAQRGGTPVEERAAIVVGADGKRSLVAYLAGAEEYNSIPARSCVYYSYWRGARFPSVVKIYLRDGHAAVVTPTNDDQLMVSIQWGIQHFARVRNDIEAAFAAAVAAIPELDELLAGATRTEKLVGTADLPNFFRKPYGNGWALVGDAGYHRDPVLAQGMTDAFHDAESLATAIDSAFRWEYDMDDALAAYHRSRDERVAAIYGLVTSFASMDPLPAEVQEAFFALQGQQQHIDRFLSVAAGSLPVQDFYSPQNFADIVAGALALAA